MTLVGSKTLTSLTASNSQIRSLVTLSKVATSVVDTARRAFASDVTQYSIVGSGSVSTYLSQFGAVAPELVLSNTQFGLDQSRLGANVLPPIPTLDSIEPKLDQINGVLDAFVVNVKFSMDETDVASVSSFEVMRVDFGRDLSVLPPSFSSLALTAVQSTRKNTDSYLISAVRPTDGVSNEITQNVKDDAFAAQKSVINEITTEPLSPNRQSNKISQYDTSLVNIAGLDQSVVSNVQFAINQRSISTNRSISIDASIGRSSGLNILKSDSVQTESLTTTSKIGDSIKIGTVSSRSADRRFGNFLEYSFLDATVSYGHTYGYFVVAVSSTGKRSVRSRLIKTSVSFKIAPPSPSVVYDIRDNMVIMNIVAHSLIVDHFEIYRAIDAFDITYYGRADCAHGAATFIDRRAPHGIPVEYRVYSVNGFGIKSAQPFSFTIQVPEYGAMKMPAAPAITAEQDVGGRAIRVSIKTDEPDIVAAFVMRRDATIEQQAFTCPNFPAGKTFGLRSKSFNSIADSRIVTDRSWNGFLRINSGSASLIDQDVAWDRNYFYSAYIVDRKGNRSDSAFSSNVFVGSRRILDAPKSLSATYSSSSITLSWLPGTSDFSVTDLLGDQDVLAATAVRSVYQVERRQAGKSAWAVYAPTTGTSHVEQVEQGVYDYRVIALQSGGLLSVYSDSVTVVAMEAPKPITTLWAKSAAGVDPVTITLSWNDDNNPDGWEIQRAEVNRVFGSGITSVNSSATANLQYTPLVKIKRESSRSLSRAADSLAVHVDNDLFVGSRWYVDGAVLRENSYFYRIRSVAWNGRTSDWTYVAFKFNDRPFIEKFNSIISASQVAVLAADPVKISSVAGVQLQTAEQVLVKSFGTVAVSTVTTTPTLRFKL